MEKTKDKYDEAVEYLTKHPQDIYKAWNMASQQDMYGSCLFRYVTKDKTDLFNTCGCLTQVRKGIRRAETKELTKAIRNSRSLPSNPEEITVQHLPLFAKWQRRIDKELGRK